MIQGLLFTKREHVKGGEDEEGEGDEGDTKSAPTCSELRPYQIRNVSTRSYVQASRGALGMQYQKGNRVQL